MVKITEEDKEISNKKQFKTRSLVTLLPVCILGFVFLWWFWQDTLISANSVETHTTPSLLQLKKVEGEIAFIPLHAAGKGSRFQNKHARIKLENGDTLLLQCYLYPTEYPDKCFNFEYKGKTISHLNELAFKKVTVLWLPMKNIDTEGLIYQIEKDGRKILSLEQFALKYKMQNRLQQKKHENSGKSLSTAVFLTIIFLLILIKLARKKI